MRLDHYGTDSGGAQVRYWEERALRLVADANSMRLIEARRWRRQHEKYVYVEGDCDLYELMDFLGAVEYEGCRWRLQSMALPALLDGLWTQDVEFATIHGPDGDVWHWRCDDVVDARLAHNAMGVAA